MKLDHLRRWFTDHQEDLLRLVGITITLAAVAYVSTLQVVLP